MIHSSFRGRQARWKAGVALWVLIKFWKAVYCLESVPVLVILVILESIRTIVFVRNVGTQM